MHLTLPFNLKFDPYNFGMLGGNLVTMLIFDLGDYFLMSFCRFLKLLGMLYVYGIFFLCHSVCGLYLFKFLYVDNMFPWHLCINHDVYLNNKPLWHLYNFHSFSTLILFLCRFLISWYLSTSSFWFLRIFIECISYFVGPFSTSRALGLILMKI